MKGDGVASFVVCRVISLVLWAAISFIAGEGPPPPSMAWSCWRGRWSYARVSGS
jgi:hypothetical protein